jgi:hypothetical protein
MELSKITESHLVYRLRGKAGSYSIRHNTPGITAEEVPEFGSLAEAIRYFDPPPPLPPEPSAAELLERARATALTGAKSAREQALAAGFEYMGHHYQTRNTADVINITGVGLAAIAANGVGQPFSVDFRTTGNEVVTMDGPTAAMFYLAMVATAQQIWAAYNASYAAIMAATTIEELEEL